MRHLNRKHWPLSISVCHCEDVVAIETWLAANIGRFRQEWNCIYFSTETVYYFIYPEDLTLFSLRWSS